MHIQMHIETAEKKKNLNELYVLNVYFKGKTEFRKNSFTFCHACDEFFDIELNVT